jgi:hypothetical protein
LRTLPCILFDLRSVRDCPGLVVGRPLPGLCDGVLNCAIEY